VVAGPSPPPSPAAAPKATLRMCRVKQLAGFGARESWRCEGRPGRHGRRGAGSRTWPRGGGRCCSRPGSARRARPGPGRGRSLKEQPLVFSDPNPRSRELFCDRVPQFVGRCHARSRGLTWENRRDTGELGRLHAITLTGPVGTVVQTTEPTAQTGILRACQLALPPRITTLDPA
jgi:hypothetical protein